MRSKSIMILNLPAVESNSRDSDSPIVSEIFNDITNNEINANNLNWRVKQNRIGARAMKIVLEDAQVTLFLIRNKMIFNDITTIYFISKKDHLRICKSEVQSPISSTVWYKILYKNELALYFL